MNLTKKIPFRKLASKIFKKHSLILNDLNSNALMLEFFSEKNKIEKYLNNRFELYDYVNPKEDIDYLEFGVYKGESIKYWMDINQYENSRFFGFDSFEGLPQSWEGFSKNHHNKGTFSLDGNTPNI
jgi:O-methyltransferase